MKLDPSWDLYFRTICDTVASKSPCLSRQIGAILVRDKSIVSTGYNGPPRGVDHCADQIPFGEGLQCPRHAAGYASGEGLHLCPATHAEMNCIVNAARLGVSTLGTTLYMNCIIPCMECLKVLINAGVEEIVVDDTTFYSLNRDMMNRLQNHSLNLLTIRKFHLPGSVRLSDKEETKDG